MTLTEEDRQALYAVWMTRKARLHLTQMEMAKQLGLTQTAFSAVLRGPAALEMPFVESFCASLNEDPYTFLPTLIRMREEEKQTIRLVSRVTVDGQIDAVQVEGNQVVIQYTYTPSL
ncbi:hypothetical protein VA7868_00302 [Vibrio aerogenes CECT 7868]|uniref:HTH cro/C1-type domain-containing protein n=1 Tax=Vibrio aerogenes CECT 7868 TaxID=1216006 RepID=A0A1M5V888_9VIBR|nr:helix-turn-helix transcriptional regulator [Vibrio aerogenes]SHH71436.1 hypothetical protein VA7868_00302 [Vibrio aerogenes CECT 7868]